MCMIRSITLLLLSFILYGADGYAWADTKLTHNSLKTYVQLTGSINDSACNISLGADDQTIAFKPAELNGFVRGNPVSHKSLSIYISDCVGSSLRLSPTPLQRFNLSFEGEAEGRNFKVYGQAQGITLQIKDERGNFVSPGMLLEYGSLSGDRLMLSYSLSLIGSGYLLEAGDFHTTIKLSIQHF